MNKFTPDSTDCEQIRKLISAYRIRHQFLQLAIALMGEEDVRLETLAEYKQIEAELEDLNGSLEKYCTDAVSSLQSIDSERVATLRNIVNQKEAKLVELDKKGKVASKFFDRMEEIEKARIAQEEGRIVLLDAPAGYGKTRLLLETVRMSAASRETPDVSQWLYRGLSFRDVRHQNEASFLHSLIQLFEDNVSPAVNATADREIITGSEVSTEDLLEQLTQQFITIGTECHKNIVLILEDAHRIRGTDFSAWLRNQFVPELRDRLFLYRNKFAVNLVVIGQFIGQEWRLVQNTQLQITLPPFSLDQIQEIIMQKAQSYGLVVPEDLSDLIALELNRLTAGHPQIVLEVLNHLIDEHRMGVLLNDRTHPNYFFGPSYRVAWEKIARENLRDLLLELSSESLREAYMVISIFRCFFPGTVRTLVEQGHIDTRLKPIELIDELQATGYINSPDMLGFYEDQVLRRVVALFVRYNHPDLFKEVHSFAWQYWDSISIKGEDVSGRKVDINDTKQIRCILEAMYHYLNKMALERGIYFGCFDPKVAEEIINDLLKYLNMLIDKLRSSGLEDISLLKKNHLLPMLKNDRELINDIRYILGENYLDRLFRAVSIK